MLIPGRSRVSCFQQWHALGLFPAVAEPPRLPVVEAPPPFGLTHREMEMVRSLAHCVSHAEISAELGCTLLAVKSQLCRIFRKTGTRNLRSLLTFAIRKGLLTVEVEARPTWMEQGQRLPR